MNYWHIQLHPNDKDSVSREEIANILKREGVIGMGEVWDGDRGQPQKFKDELAIGDVVLIRHGGSPLALVRVAGNWFHNENEDLWFEIVREIQLLAIDESKQIKYQYKESTGKNWTEGIYAATTFEGANNYPFIKYWHQLITTENLMSNIRLNDKRQNELRQMWLEYRSTYSKEGIATIQKDIDSIQNEWNKYREKIDNGTITIDDYINRKPNDYLCNFLERETRDVYGSSKPGNANNFEVKLNSDGTTYTFRNELKRGEKENHHSKDEAIDKFNKEIKPLLESVLKADALGKTSLIEETNYSAKQLLRKMAAIENKDAFLYIYADNVIDDLHREFLDSDMSRNLEKNYEIRTLLNSLLEIEPDNTIESVLLSRFLWKYATLSGIADQDSPNVILYGPPGTGKTYMVQESLSYLCQGDKSRYEILQFHPSFTYEDFIEGIKPKGVTKDGNIKFEMVDGVFKKFCKRAKAECMKANSEKREPNAYYFIVDEINRANLSSVFGETLTLLEKGYRHDGLDGDNLIKTQYSGLIEDLIKEDSDKQSLAYHFENGNVYFGIPENVYFIGMMNDVDKSIDTFDLALRRRFKWIRKDCDYDVIENDVKFRNGDDFSNIESYKKACEELNNFISQELGLGKSYEFGHSFFMKITSIANSKKISTKNIEVLFKLHLQPTFKEYLRAMYPESELDQKIEEALKKFIKPLKEI